MPTPNPAEPPAASAPSADRPPVSPVPVVRRWVCCHCGGTGLTGDGDTCPHCHGHGHD
ncbi:hypothetical protein SAMN04489712_15011 [Thermomonospora echinospora]|uniref:Uncharacterized protein n=1 Tax=Thermomonospora echinospora TaxID=1992 RepID=A0A1H6ECF0_9ACTN|nr:hypothetical protein [Thermomonospora echinospora]SEG94699.1 hypothetical protein SAMN04489712_15011 [Thermomonospora echinospora]